jgi:hypothetical protein
MPQLRYYKQESMVTTDKQYDDEGRDYEEQLAKGDWNECKHRKPQAVSFDMPITVGDYEWDDTPKTNIHECYDYKSSLCCGAKENMYVEGFCDFCSEATGFACRICEADLQ